jgi:membrane-associated phospholipid phosphatase
MTRDSENRAPKHQDYSRRPAHGTPPHDPPRHDQPRGSPLAARVGPGRAAAIFASGVIVAALLLPIDDLTARAATHLQDGGSLRLGGDLRRTLLLLQQFGDVPTSIIAALIVLLLDRARRHQLLDWLLAAVVTAVLGWLLKVAIGRPRPRVILSDSALDGYTSSLWFGASVRPYPLPRSGATIATAPDTLTHAWRHSWELTRDISSDLWSMPSSHSSAAAVLAAVLSRMYPPLAPLCLSLLAIVMAARIVFGAHYPSDVALGAAIGLAVGLVVMDARLGQRLAQRLGLRTPAPAP